MGAADKIYAYRTMRAVEKANATPPPEKPTRWQRWQAWCQRMADRVTIP